MRNIAKMVYIAGAGPGDPDLLSVKLYRIIQVADVILYDQLVNLEILKNVKTGAELVYVGKVPGKPCRSQEETNALLIKYARTKDVVLRLKGGDPFVFGRGGEEALVLKNEGIKYEIIPGISSHVSAAAYAGIPITHRNISCQFTVATGHESPDKPEGQIKWAEMNTHGTLVILMGIANRQSIAQNLIKSGRPADQPVAFIENGTMRSQNTIFTTLGKLATRCIEVRAPAVMIVGDVVSLSRDLSWFQQDRRTSQESASTPTQSP